MLDGLEGTPEIGLASPAARRRDGGPGSGERGPGPAPVHARGPGGRRTPPTPWSCGCWGSSWPRRAGTLEIITDTESPLQVAEQVAERSPRAGRRLAPAAGGADLGPLPGPSAAGEVRRPADRGGPLGRERRRRLGRRPSGGERGDPRGRDARGTRDRILRLLSPATVQDELPSPVTV